MKRKEKIKKLKENHEAIVEEIKQQNEEIKEEIREKIKDSIKIPLLSSISTKIVSLVMAGTLLMAALLVWTFVPMVQKEVKKTVQSYLVDEAKMCGEIIDKTSSLQGEALTLEQSYMSSVLGSVKISDYESSYAYAVSGDGTMIYHPQTDKVGKPVENEAINNVVDMIQNGNYVSSGFVSYTFDGVEKFAAYSVACDNKCIVVVAADEKDTLAEINSISRTCLIRSLIIMAFIGIAAFFLSKTMTKPIVKVTNSIFRLSNLELSVDDYTKKMCKRRDETGYIARAIDKLANNLGNVIHGIQKQSSTLFTTSEELSDNASDTVNSVRQVEIAVSEVAEGANSQAVETTEATNHVIDMGNMIETTDKEADKIKESAVAIEEAANEATDILKSLLTINEQALDSVGMIYERTNTTNQSVEEIKSAISIITSIAEETNLLSLNASIEAARAGEQGRGFAVVASQIQKLAEQSNESASQIAIITEKLISDSNQAVEGMQEVRTIMERQSEHVTNTNKAFDKVKYNINESMKGIDEIVDTTTQLDNTRNAVTDTVQNLSAIAQENAASSEECSASVTEVCTIMDKITADTVRLKEISKEIDDQLKSFVIE